jgi:predicted nucleic-acid-binding Zn-ribbon protein
MNRTETFKALVNITGGAADGKINTSSGLVVMPFVCEECGYLELYVADKTQHEKK